MNLDIVNTPLDVIAALFFAAMVQVIKHFSPESAERDKKYIAAIVIVATSLVSVVRFFVPLAYGELLAPSIPMLVLYVFWEAFEGALIGAAAVGAYEMGHNLFPNVLRSTSALLVKKTEVDKRIEVTEVQPVTEVKEEVVTEVTYEPKVAEFVSEAVEIKKVKKSK